MANKFEATNTRDFVKELSEVLRGKAGTANLSTVPSTVGAPAQPVNFTAQNFAFVQEALTLVSEAQLSVERYAMNVERLSEDNDNLRTSVQSISEQLSAANVRMTEFVNKFNDTETEKIKVIAEKEALAKVVQAEQTASAKVAEEASTEVSGLKVKVEELSNKVSELMKSLVEKDTALRAAEDKINQLAAQALGALEGPKGDLTPTQEDLTAEQVLDKVAGIQISEDQKLVQEYEALRLDATMLKADEGVRAQRKLTQFVQKNGRRLGVI